MPQRRREAYPAEFKAKLIALVLAGRTPEELADEFEPTGQMIRNWVRQAQLNNGDRRRSPRRSERPVRRSRDGLKSDEHAEMAQLRKRVKQLEMEREILSKVGAWFARQSTELPKRSSRS